MELRVFLAVVAIMIGFSGVVHARGCSDELWQPERSLGNNAASNPDAGGYEGVGSGNDGRGSQGDDLVSPGAGSRGDTGVDRGSSSGGFGGGFGGGAGSNDPI